MICKGMAMTFGINARVVPGSAPLQRFVRRYDMLGTILLIVLILLLIGVIPAWPHSRGWGYTPSGVLGLVLIILVILLLLGKL
jgi:hypothetical protein